MLGRTADEVIGQPLTLITHPDDVARDLQAVTDAVAGRIDVYRTEKRYVRPDGSLVWATVSESAIRDTEGRAMYAVALIEDSTDRRSATLALEHRATHDALTGLSNRSALEQHLGSLMVAAERRTVRAALVFCDLDRFKEINDRHGHAVGDHILRHVGARLLSQARSGDLVARLGGDEFVVVAEGVSDPEAEAFAQRIRFALTGPVTVGELTLEVQVSVGVTTFGGGERTPTELLAAADAAMYAAKRARERTGPAAERSDDPQLGQRG
jgi:diguanylate cyclase (GGDEF)-like protein/PAS domain S-box-containing protein